jgi:hypothetical protein
LGGVYRLSKSTDNNTFSIDRYDNSGLINANGWVSLLSLEFNDETNATKFYVNKLNIFDLINARVSTSDLTNALTYYALYSETYTKTISNSLFNGKLNNNTGTISTSIKNNGGEDVAIFYNTKDVVLKGNVDVLNNLSVNGTSVLSNTLKIQCFGSGGNIRAVPSSDGGESSIGFYKYIDMRTTAFNDVWIVGQNCWDNEGFSIGTPGTNACLNIDSAGNVLIPYNLTVPGTLNSNTNAATYTAPFNANTAQISLNGSTGNYINWGINGASNPSTNTRATGTKILLYPSINVNELDYAIGLDPSSIWFSVARSSSSFKWYCGTNMIGVLSGGGMVVNNQIYKYNSIITSLNSSTTLTISQLLGNIIICNSSNVINLTLPTGNLTHGGMIVGGNITFTLNQGFEWSIINTGSSVGVVVIVQAALHSYVGNAAVDIGKSARFFTKIGDTTNVATTYRIS